MQLYCKTLLFDRSIHLVTLWEGTELSKFENRNLHKKIPNNFRWERFSIVKYELRKQTLKSGYYFMILICIFE